MKLHRPMKPGLFRKSGLPLLLSAVLLSACGGGDSPSDPGGEEPRVVKANPSFATDIQEIFDRKGCTASGCHGNAQQGGLDLRAAAAFDQLVGVTASAEPIQRVIPGNPQGSYLVIRVEGRQVVGSRMPLGGTPLDNVDLTNLRNWIQQGAPDN
jgi:hypothetical protein